MGPFAACLSVLFVCMTYAHNIDKSRIHDIGRRFCPCTHFCKVSNDGHSNEEEHSDNKNNNDEIHDDSMNDDAVDRPMNNGAMDNPMNDGAMDLPMNDGAMDNPMNDGAMDNPMNDGAMDNPMYDGAMDNPMYDGAMDLPMNDGAMDLSMNNGAMDSPIDNRNMVSDDNMDNSIYNETIATRSRIAKERNNEDQAITNTNNKETIGKNNNDKDTSAEENNNLGTSEPTDASDHDTDCKIGQFYEFSDDTQTVSSQTVSCCSDCSCADDCWKTANCCPDKDDVREEPTLICKSPVVKPPSFMRPSKRGNLVIETCPNSETNVSLIAKCMAKEKRNFEDFIWVSDENGELIYQNKFCALCHHVANYVTWEFKPTCSGDHVPLFDSLDSVLLSDGCQLELRTPANMSFSACVVPDYYRCNQTGLWRTYDADIDWACNAYHSEYFYNDSSRREIVTYRNVFCYYCNTEVPEPTQPMCTLSKHFLGISPPLTDLIYYKGYQSSGEGEISSNPACAKNEVLDEILGICRTLMCPFGSQPVFGTCQPIFDEVLNLPVEVWHGLTAVWSMSNISMTDDLHKPNAFGKAIFAALIKESPVQFYMSRCFLCRTSVVLLSNLSASYFENASKHENGTYGDVYFKDENSRSSPDFIVRIILNTTPKCQLEDIIDEMSNLTGKSIKVEINGKTEMILKYENVDDCKIHADEGITLFTGEMVGCLPFSTYRIRGEFCPEIEISYSEFAEYLTEENLGAIDALFTYNKTAVDICLDDYYRKLKGVDFNNNSHGDILLSSDILACILVVHLYNT